MKDVKIPLVFKNSKLFRPRLPPLLCGDGNRYFYSFRGEIYEFSNFWRSRPDLACWGHGNHCFRGNPVERQQRDRGYVAPRVGSSCTR
ncbi:protein of unknown function [Methylocaldum szegediense]|uniref:Cytochrome b5 heme-binding domain-containing protein n=1 Tax=Methylocaldum szegediense TaxID=73780 RepID=A0ABN8X0D2_9GAMM|nr:protein of unknown function [Methylocaldum szegediense]